MLQRTTRLVNGVNLCAGAYAATALTAMTWPVSAWAIGALVGSYLFRRGKQSFWSHGTARWADLKRDLISAGMVNADSGLILGRVDKKIIRLPQAVHSSVFGPTGAGKGVSFVIPFLQTCTESAVITDFKSDLYDETAAICKDQLRHQVVRLAPFDKNSDQFNPLALIDPNSPHVIDDCNDLAKYLVVRTGDEKDPHWNDSAEILIASVLATVVGHSPPELRTLNSVREILSHPQTLENTIKLMLQSEHWGGALRNMGGQLQHFQGEEKSSVLSTCLRHLDFLSSPTVAQSVSRSSFNPANLRQGKMRIYLTIPPERAQAQRGLLRMWIGSLINACTRQGLSRPGLGKVHFVIDEAALVMGGRMECIEDALTVGRASDIRLQLYFQSLGQLHRCFPKGQEMTFLANTNQTYFAINDLEMAEAVSKRLGEETILVNDSGYSVGVQSGRNEGGRESSRNHGRTMTTSYNTRQTPRRLLKPEELMVLSPRVAITFVPGMPPIRTWLLRYYEEKMPAKPRGKVMFEIARFLRALVLCPILIAFARALTPSFINAFHVLTGR